MTAATLWSERRLPESHRRALRAMVDGGALYVVVGGGPFCRPCPRIGSGVILHNAGRLEVSARAVRLIRRLGTRWDPEAKALVLDEPGRERAGLALHGRDLLIP